MCDPCKYVDFRSCAWRAPDTPIRFLQVPDSERGERIVGSNCPAPSEDKRSSVVDLQGPKEDEVATLKRIR